MRSKVKFNYKDTDHKHAFIEPASVEIKKALEEKEGRSELYIEVGSGNLGFQVLKKLLQVEILSIETPDDRRLEAIQAEILENEEARLLKSFYDSLRTSTNELDKEIYNFLKEKLQTLKWAGVLKEAAKRRD